MDTSMSSQIAMLNLQVALDRVGGDSELLAEVARLFLMDSPRSMGEIRKAIDEGDAKLLEREAHSLKGSASNFGAQPVVDAALALEQMGRAGNLAAAPEGLNRLIEVLGQFERELATL